jgi:DNA-binding transcriptional LysR family regulator
VRLTEAGRVLARHAAKLLDGVEAVAAALTAAAP